MRPNWKNDESYAFTEQLDRSGWAWEFLRRNPDYRADSLKYRSILSELIDEYGLYNDNGFQWDEDPRFMVEHPPRHPQTGKEEWPPECVEAERMRFDVWLAYRWGLQYPADPDKVPENIPWQDRFLGLGCPTVFFNKNGIPDRIEKRAAGPLVHLQFDLRVNIDNQLLDAKKKLMRWQQEAIDDKRITTSRTANLQYQQWRRYLRILDGREECKKTKLPFIEMNKIIYAEKSLADFEDTADKDKFAAEKLMKSKYLKVLLSPKKVQPRKKK